jgi:hypothetical protein
VTVIVTTAGPTTTSAAVRGTYSFTPHVSEPDRYGAYIFWWCNNPEDHVPGKSRWMTGVLLTEQGRQAVKEDLFKAP